MPVNEQLEFDRKHIWHPYSSASHPLPVYPIERAEGVRLFLEGGRPLIDGMSSWWSVIHGYNHPEINRAAIGQIEKMSHVMFGGITHAPAVEMCQTLMDILPDPLQWVFPSDSGSIAVEIALKMAVQYWVNLGKPKKKTFLTVKNGYHGDTLGAMSLCDPDTGMHSLFEGYMPKQLFAPPPTPGFDGDFEASHIKVFAELAESNAHKIAAVVLEPIVQGAGGMRFYSPKYLSNVRLLCDNLDILLIADEIATGFGRTGTLFACEHAYIAPDIMCVGKALTGGYLTLAATFATDPVARTVSKNGNVLMHGPTFMGNPLACAVANASLKLLMESPWKERIKNIEKILDTQLSMLRDVEGVSAVRVLGAIGVVEMSHSVDVVSLQREFVKRGVWIRPFANLIYIMPPYVINNEDLNTLCNAIVSVVSSATP